MSKKKKKILMQKIRIISVFLFIIFSIILIVLGITKTKAKQSKATQVLTQYVKYIGEQNYDLMYELLDSSSQKNITKEEFIQKNKEIYEKLELTSISVYDIVEEEIESDRIKITCTNDMETIAGKLVFTNTIRIAKEENECKILWNTNTIIPGLNDTDTLKIDTTNSTRGCIYDRNGKGLALEGKVSEVGLVPGKMSDKKDEDINKLAGLINVSAEKIKKSINASYVKSDTFVKLAEISSENTELESKLLEIKGVMISTVKGRLYPYKEVTSHLIGYVQKISEEEIEENPGKGYSTNSVIGKVGLEKAFEDKLRGLNGYEIYIVDVNRKKKKNNSK